MDVEIRFHLEMETAETVRRGMNEEEARRAALRGFGGVEQTKEAYRDITRFRWVEDLWQDLRYGARMLLKQPGFTLVAALTLSLGIGANTAIFSVVNAVLLRPLPYAEPERLVALWESNTQRPEGRNSISYPNFFDWRAQSKSFERMASYYTNDMALTGAATPVNLRSVVVSPDLFAGLGVRPQLGRWFVAEEEKPGIRAAIINHGLWQRQFGGDPNIVGRAVTLNGKPSTSSA